MSQQGRAQKLYKFLGSTELAVALFLAIALIAIPGTFLESREIYASLPFLSLLGIFGLNLILCTLGKLKRLSLPVLILHGGVLVTLVGCIATSFGSVATVNVYEGTSVDKVYRWDLDQDVPLGAQLAVKQIHQEYYPIPIQVGVLKGEKKEALFTLKTGQSFTIGGYRVVADALEFPFEVLKLSVYQSERLVGHCDTAGAGDLPAGFPYSFKLVAFVNPVMKRLAVDLAITKPGEPAVIGTTAVNSPLTWQGMYFYNTQINRDPQGSRYAGIQVVRDPGRPYVFSGFALMGIGAVLLYFKRFFKKGLWS